MCTCCHNWTNTANTVNTAVNGCGANRCYNGCTNVTQVQNGCYHGCANVTQVQNGCYGCGRENRRYITFPISGRAVVPVSAICFYPTTWGTTNGYCLYGNTTPTTGTATSNGNCCGFGRCGGAAAIANFNEDYYARQYGLND